jgi:hypothetical protein
MCRIPAHEMDRLHDRRLGLDPVRAANLARFVFFDPRATDFYIEWDTVASDVVALFVPKPDATRTTVH